MTQLQSELDNLQHRLKLDAANHKIEVAKAQRELLQQHEQDNLRIQGRYEHHLSSHSPISRLELEEKLAALQSDKSKLQSTIQEKEHQLLTTVQATREDEWKKISEITNEK